MRDDKWWDKPWSPLGGCEPISPGCLNCVAAGYASQEAWRWPKGTSAHHGVTKLVAGRAVFNGKLTRLPDTHHIWDMPLRWAGATNPKLGVGQPSLIFAVDMGELFLNRPKADIDRVVETLVLSPHIGLLCTKLTKRMAEYFSAIPARQLRRWQERLWLGFSAEEQRWFDQRWQYMRPLAAAGWPMFASLGPMLGPIKLPADYLEYAGWAIASGEQPATPNRLAYARCRPMDADWARAVRDQCKAAGIAFFCKQMSRKAPRPPDLRILEFPTLELMRRGIK
jgi:protein gp37